MLSSQIRDMWRVIVGLLGFSALQHREARPVVARARSGSVLRTLFAIVTLGLMANMPGTAWALSAGCNAINTYGGTFTINNAGVGTDKYTDSAGEVFNTGEVVTYSWTGNVKGAYVNINYTANNAYVNDGVFDSTATSGSGSFTLTGTQPGDYFAVSLQEYPYFTSPAPHNTAVRNSSVSYTLSCGLPSASLGVTMSHSGNASQSSALAYTITPSVSGGSTSSATLTAAFTLPTGMTYTSAGGSGWSCSGSGQNGSCTRTSGFASGAGPTITLNTAFAANATSPLVPQVQLSGGGASNAPTATDSTVVNPRPTVTSVSPTSGTTAGGTSVVITGTSFTGTSGAAGVKFGAISATSYTVNSNTQITAVVPPSSAGTYDITVTNAGNISATSAADQYTYVTAPTVASISPTSGPTVGGTSVIISGTGFSAAPTTGAVKFGATVATYTINSSTQITASAPANSAGPYDVTVTTPGGVSTTSAADQFTYIAAPTVTSLSPNSGPASGNATVIITGSGFSGAPSTGAVKFGSNTATYTINSNTQITATSPAGSAGTVNITITTPGGISNTSAASQYTYVTAPTVSGISPGNGPAAGGTTVTIIGSGYTSAPGTGAVKFGATVATYTINSNTQITATAPAGTGTVDITVTTPGGTSTTSIGDQFTYNPAPAVTSVSPNSGPTAGGTSVTLTGTDFTGVTAVTFGATAATGFTFNSATSITATAPAGSAGTVNIRVTTLGGTSATGAGNQFTYVAAPTVTSISPTSGSQTGGTTVVITGTNFSGSTAVTFGATAATGFTVNSATQITATAPAGTGTVDVRVTAAGGTSTTSGADQFTYVAAPTVTSVSPTSGPAAGGTTVVITGTNFSGSTAVTFGATAATGFTVNSATQITATAPAGTGTVDVRVTATGGTSTTSGADQFTYVGAPTVTSLSPTAGPNGGGTTVVITGTNFSGSTAVTFGGTAATGFTVNSATQITATAPAGTGTVDVRVTTIGGISTTNAADQFTYVAAPTVTSISPTAGQSGGGTTVVITGTNFSGSTAVTFGATAATGFTVNSATQITATAPAGTGTVDVRVTTAGGTSATSGADQFTYVAAPTVSSISPTSGPATGGTTVVITGSNFSGSTAVTFGGTAATGFTVNSATQITATAPAGTGTVNIRVTTLGGTSATGAGNQFTYVGAPTVTSISPTVGPNGGGTSVVITGTNFSGSTAVTFGGTAATGFTVNSATQITATAPAGTGTVDVRVTTAGGTSTTSAADQFTYVAAPTVTSIAPTSGPAAGSTTVVITGSNFSGSTAVTFGGTAATGFTVNSATQITATAPAGTGTVDIRVTTAGGTSATSGADQFTYVAAPTITAVSPSSGPTAGGTSVVITGTNFAGASAVTFGATAVSGFTVNSATQITTTSPAGTGTVDIRITTTGGTSATALADQYNYVAAPTAADKNGVTVNYNSTGTAIDLSTSITGVHSSISIGNAPAHGTTSIVGDVVTYTPTTGYFGADSFTYKAIGTGGSSSSATVSLTVSTPTAPTAADLNGVNVAYNSSGTAIDLSGSITGVHGSIAIGTAPAHGTTSIAGDVVTYTPAANYYGADSFTYTATGPGGTSAPATVSLSVANPAAPTVANISGVTVAFDSSGTAIDVSTSITGIHSSIAIGTAPAHGTTSISGDVVTYIPTTGYYGADSFTYTATGPGGTSAPATVSLTVANPAAPTVANISGVTVAYGSSGTAIDVSTSITGVHSSIAIGTASAHGTTSISGDVVTYTPAAGYYGADSFTYTATGPGGTSAPATVSVTVTNPAAPTVANVSGVTVAYDSSGTAIDVSTSITGVHSSIAIGTAPAHGTASISGDIVTYIPTTGYYGADSFTYTATGPGGTSAPATVSLSVANPAAPTVANVSGVNVAYNSGGTAIDVSTSITGLHSSIAIGTAPAHGMTSVSGSMITYTPAAGYYGADSFTYTATGAGGTSAPATISLTVATPVAPTTANVDNVAVVYASSGTAIDLSLSLTGVHSGVAIATAPAHGTASVSGNIVTYIPAATYYGADSFTYTATGPGGSSTPATVSLSVGNPPAPAAANKGNVAIPYNSTGSAIDLSSSVTGVHSSLTVATAPAHGTVSLTGDVATYIPADGYYGADSFTYSATGPGGTSAAASVQLTVATPPPPVSLPGATTVASSLKADTSVDINLSALVQGRYDSIQISTPPAHGTVTLSAGQSARSVTSQAASAVIATYIPAARYNGPDSFSFVAVGPGGTSAPGVVTVTVLGAVPTAQAKTASAIDGQKVSIDLTAGALDGPFTAATVVSVTPAGKATTQIVQGGTSAAPTYRLDVTPEGHFNGTLVVSYTLSNQFGTSAPAPVTITVTARPDPSADPTVRALSDAQAETTRRFAQAQSRNFLQRAEQLHNGGGSSRPHMGTSLSARDGNGYARAPRAGDDRGALDITDRMRAGADMGGTENSALPARAEGGPSGGPRDVGAVAVWSGGAIDIGTMDKTTRRTKISFATSGLSAGADVKLSPEVTVGLGGGVSFEKSNIGNGAAHLQGDSRVVAAYASATPANGIFLDGVLGYGTLDFHTRRLVQGLVAKGSRNGDMWFGAISAGVDRQSGAFRWSTYGRIDWLDGTLDAYRENGAGIMDLRFDARPVRSLSSVLGGRLEWTKGHFQPRIRAEWQHELRNASTQMLDYADFTGQAIYGITTDGWKRDSYELGVGSRIILPASWIFDIEVSGRGAQNVWSGRAMVKVTKEF